MFLIAGILAAVLIILIELNTISYAVWNWRHENKTGALAVTVVCLLSAALPIYIVFFNS